MPRRVIPPTSDFPYHVSARAHNREHFHISDQEMWSVFSDYLSFVARAYEFQILSFVMMPNHFHLLVRTPAANLSEGMNYFMREVARETSRLSGRINQTFGSRHHKTIVSNAQYFFDVYKYVYRNPVRAGLCSRVEDYPYSTLRGLLGFERISIPLGEDTILFGDERTESVLAWLNENPQTGLEDEVRQALRHRIYELNTPRRTNRSSLLLSQRL